MHCSTNTNQFPNVKFFLHANPYMKIGKEINLLLV